MTDKMRLRSRYVDTNPVAAAVDSATVIEIGDLLWQDIDDAKPASMVQFESRPDFVARGLGDEAYELLRQERFAEAFLGVAMERSRSGDTDPVRVGTTGVFEFDCPSGTFELGDLVGVRCLPGIPDRDASVAHWRSERLVNQEVQKVAASQYAIGRVAKFEHEPVTSVLVDIRSRVMGQ